LKVTQNVRFCCFKSVIVASRNDRPGDFEVDKTINLVSASMKAKTRFSEDVLALLRKTKGVRIRAGISTHRFIGIWFVIVDDRVFVRSWSVTPNGWYRILRKSARGRIQTAAGEISIRAIPVRSKNLRDAVDHAYLDRYNTPGALKYAKDLSRAKSRATTVELVPWAST
jgi:hypothetical protein